MRCIVIRGDAWLVLLSLCNTHAATGGITHWSSCSSHSSRFNDGSAKLCKVSITVFLQLSVSSSGHSLVVLKR